MVFATGDGGEARELWAARFAPELGSPARVVELPQDLAGFAPALESGQATACAITKERQE
jgi:hypothetical protein